MWIYSSLCMSIFLIRTLKGAVYAGYGELAVMSYHFILAALAF